MHAIVVDQCASAFFVPAMERFSLSGRLLSPSLFAAMLHASFASGGTVPTLTQQQHWLLRFLDPSLDLLTFVCYEVVTALAL